MQLAAASPAEPAGASHPSSDTRYLIKYGATPTVIFGPGLTEQMHATDEWVDIDGLMAVTKILALTRIDWCEEA